MQKTDYIKYSRHLESKDIYNFLKRLDCTATLRSKIKIKAESEITNEFNIPFMKLKISENTYFLYNDISFGIYKTIIDNTANNLKLSTKITEEFKILLANKFKKDGYYTHCEKLEYPVTFKEDQIKLPQVTYAGGVE